MAAALTPEVVRDNHYVSCGLMRRWSEDGLRIHAYRTLVSHRDVPSWSAESIRNVAYARDLYTNVEGGTERDDFEKWIETEYETPGLAAVDKLVGGRQLSPDDWRSLVRLYASQHVRTPTSYLEFKEWCDRQVQPMLETVVTRGLGRVRDAKDRARDVPPSADAPAGGTHATQSGIGNEFSGLIRVRVDDTPDADGNVSVRAEVTVGRSLWIAQMRSLLNRAAKRLHEHRWHIYTPYGDEEWPLTDHPALRVNYNGPNNYNVDGSWDSTGSDLMMPLSPRHLLHVRGGFREEPRVVCSLDVTRRIQRIYAETALRRVFGTRAYPWVEKWRPRTVDAERYKDEQNQWRGWHSNQVAADQSS